MYRLYMYMYTRALRTVVTCDQPLFESLPPPRDRGVRYVDS